LSQNFWFSQYDYIKVDSSKLNKVEYLFRSSKEKNLSLRIAWS
jgi:hypothetical protein